MPAEEYRFSTRFPVHSFDGESFWVIVEQLWFSIDGLPPDRDRWQASGLLRYRLRDGRPLRPMSSTRFIVEDSGMELRRSDAPSRLPLAALGHWQSSLAELDR